MFPERMPEYVDKEPLLPVDLAAIYPKHMLNRQILMKS